MNLLDKYLPKTVVEKGEYYKDSKGVHKVVDAPSHDDTTLIGKNKKRKVKSGNGGLELIGVESVVSDTHRRRNSKDKSYTEKDEEIKIMPDEVESFSFIKTKKPKKGISPSNLIDLQVEAKNKIVNTYNNSKYTKDIIGANTALSNKQYVESLPSLEETYDAVLNLQESKKKVSEDGNIAQTGKIDPEKIYKTIKPSNFRDVDNFVNYALDRERTEYDDPKSEEFFRQYLGINDTPKYIKPSQYKPSISTNPDTNYYSMQDDSLKTLVRDYALEELLIEPNERIPISEYDLDKFEKKNLPKQKPGWFDNIKPSRNNDFPTRARALGNFTVSRGEDENGREYISYYDKYDFPEHYQKRMNGKPFEIYDRIYLENKQDQLVVNEDKIKQLGGKLRKYLKR